MRCWSSKGITLEFYKNKMIILIQEPGKVCSLQTQLQCCRNHYLSNPTRISRVNNKTKVLDVRLPLIAPNFIFTSPYRIIEGHTRFYEAARQGVGIEAFLAPTIEDLDKAPAECFTTLNRTDCKLIYASLDSFQQEAMTAGITYIQDLLK